MVWQPQSERGQTYHWKQVPWIMLKAIGRMFPEAKNSRCSDHFCLNVFTVTPRSKMKLVAQMFKAIHAQESKRPARGKTRAMVEALHSMKQKGADIENFSIAG